MDDIRVERHDRGEDPEERKRAENRKAGCAVILFGIAFIVAAIIATPLVVMLYKFAFGG